MKRITILAVLLLGGCGSSIPGDGYDKIKYGMTAAELQALGLSCSGDECRLSDAKAPDGGPKMGTVARVTATLHQGKVASIDLLSTLYGDDEMIGLYTDAYGKPDVCRFSNFLGATVERHVWTAGNGATIDISKIMDSGAAPDLSGLTGGSSGITYRDAAQSREFASHSC